MGHAGVRESSGQAAAPRIRGIIRPLVLVAITCALLGGPGAASALGATPATPYDFLRFSAIDPQTNGRFGDRMKDAGDIDGDGVGDVWIGVYDRDIGDLPNVGRVYALSGKNRSILYQIDSPEPQACSGLPFCGFGWSVSNLGDVDGDAVNDLVVGSVRHHAKATGERCTPPADGCNAQQGKAWVFSGAPGKQAKPLYALNNPQPQAIGAFGWASTAGDVVKADGTAGKDGISEVLVGAFQNDFPTPGCGNANPVDPPCRKDQGQAFIFNGAPDLPPNQQRLVRTLDVPEDDRYVDPTGVCNSGTAGPANQRCGGLGIVNEGVGDVNGDGFWDQSVTAWTTGVNPTTGNACYGTQDQREAPEGPCNERQGRIYIYSGADGSLLRKVDNPEPQQNALLGLQIVEAGAPGDVNGDGHADIYANGFTQHGDRYPNPEADTEGQSWVLSGKTGAVLYNLTDPTPERGGQFGYSLAKTDFNKDGRPDLYVGSSPHHEPGTKQSGGTYVFDGPSGALRKIFDLPATDAQAETSPADVGPQLGRSVAAPEDLNGDGEPDFIAGAPTINASYVNEGRLYFFLSRPPQVGPTRCPTGTSAGVTCKARPGGGLEITGTAGDDTIVGTNVDDVIRARGGNDYVLAGAGNDQVDGGRGDDRLKGGDGNDRITGGDGNDSVLAGSGDDVVNGDAGNDRLYGEAGNDRISGGAGADRISGNAGHDVLAGNSGNDTLYGDSGRDRLFGGWGDDRLFGGSGRDALDGGPGRDQENQ